LGRQTSQVSLDRELTCVDSGSDRLAWPVVGDCWLRTWLPEQPACKKDHAEGTVGGP
jgi:hypothetical protein